MVCRYGSGPSSICSKVAAEVEVEVEVEEGAVAVRSHVAQMGRHAAANAGFGRTERESIATIYVSSLIKCVPKTGLIGLANEIYFLGHYFSREKSNAGVVG
jgi:hypothetical protein